MALQSGSPTWGKGAVAESSTLLRVLPREVIHVRPKSHIPLLRANDTWGMVPLHILINLRLWGLGAANGPCLRLGCLLSLVEGFGGVEGAEALNCVPEECFPCTLRHGSLQGGVVGVKRGEGEGFIEGVEAVAPLSPACSPCPTHPAAELPQGGGEPPGEVGGGVGGGLRAWGPGAAVLVVWGVGGAGPGVPFVRGGNVDMGRRWHAGWHPWELELRERGPGEFWRRRGEQEGWEWGLSSAVLQGRGGEASCPVWIRCVGGLRRVGWVRRREWQVVRVQFWSTGLSRIRLAIGGAGLLGRGRGRRADTVPSTAGGTPWC